jgi:hypothetical protein
MDPPAPTIDGTVDSRSVRSSFERCISACQARVSLSFRGPVPSDAELATFSRFKEALWRRSLRGVGRTRKKDLSRLEVICNGTRGVSGMSLIPRLRRLYRCGYNTLLAHNHCFVE